MNKVKLIDNIHSSLNALKVDSLKSALLATSGASADKATLPNSQNSTIFPFNRKKNMKFERLEDENIIISPYFDCISDILPAGTKDLSSVELFNFKQPVRTDWCCALACDFEEKTVIMDAIEAFGSLWRLVKVKSAATHSTSNALALEKGKVQTVSINSVGNQLHSASFEHVHKFHLQCCEIGAAALFLTRDLGMSARLDEAAEFVFVPVLTGSGGGTSAAAGGGGAGRNNVADNNVFGKEWNAPLGRLWSVVCGLWSVVCGLWSVVCARSSHYGNDGVVMLYRVCLLCVLVLKCRLSLPDQTASTCGKEEGGGNLHPRLRPSLRRICTWSATSLRGLR